MAVEDHPRYAEWNAALERMVAAERGYYAALMDGKSPGDVEHAAIELDEARASYLKIADEIG